MTGTASDVGGVVAGVEVSTDGGNTWHPAISQVGATTVNWTYTFQAGPPGTTTIKSRAVDDSLDLGVPGTGVTYTITPVNTIFSSTATPAIITVNDPNAVDLGVKFSSSVSGSITGIRFYKGPLNTGTHIGNLWSSNGTLLASATFTNETASGWQQVTFSSPVPITAGTTYIASYQTNGDYSVNVNFFATSLSFGALTTPSNAGVYAYSSANAFPTNSYQASNYWVDVIFNATPAQPPVATNDSGFVTAKNSTLSIPVSVLLANDTDPNGLTLSIMGASNPSTGSTVNYNSSTQAINFVPAANYTGPASFTYTISDGLGTASATVALSVNASPPPVANNDSGFVTSTNSTLSIPASALLANDTDPNGLTLSITGVSNPSNGTVTYNSSTQTISFVPTANYTGPAGFAYTISDGQGTASANVALSVNATLPPVANNDSEFATLRARHC